MQNELKIPKKSALAEEKLDFASLRARGEALLQAFAGKVWTDFNLHDPGVTVLEALCYAITDLAYRASWPVEDLLAGGSVAGAESVSPLFPAADVLPMGPVTREDYRKLLIDIDGVQNAWLVPARCAVHFDPESGKLKPEPVANGVPVELKGIYTVLVARDPDSTIAPDALKNRILDQLNRHRNLCEDFDDVIPVQTQPFVICAEIDLEIDADRNAIAATIFEKIKDYLAPPVRFRNLDEMMSPKGAADGAGATPQENDLPRPMTSEEIFDGPLLVNGFLPTGELTDADHHDLRKSINLSDVIDLIMDIEGVANIRDIVIVPQQEAELPAHQKWVIPVDDRKLAVLVAEQSRLVFYKDVVPALPDLATVNALLDGKKVSRGAAGRMRFDDPAGRTRDIAGYCPVQNELPRTYGTGETGLPETAPEARRARARQLKGYLMVFEQVLANHFAQLAHVGDVFSIDDVAGTYFTQKVPGVLDDAALYRDCQGVANDVRDLTEKGGSDLFFQRRHRFLDHLLARFGEDLSDYLWKLLMVGNHDESAAVADKAAFLRAYPDVGYKRAVAVDYRHGTIRSSGLEERLKKLLALKDDEPLYLVEHILLRPHKEVSVLLPICPGDDGSFAEGKDPYSFRLTVVLPAGAGRFDDMDFRRFVEKTIRLETPAHIMPRICWIDADQMKSFGKRYEAWLENRAEAGTALLGEICRLRNVYRNDATLVDGAHPKEGATYFILDQTIIGTMPEEEEPDGPEGPQ